MYDPLETLEAATRGPNGESWEGEEAIKFDQLDCTHLAEYQADLQAEDNRKSIIFFSHKVCEMMAVWPPKRPHERISCQKLLTSLKI